MKRLLRVKRRINGIGGDPSYMEYYLHNGFKEYGYTLTREKEKASFKVTAYSDFRIDYVYYEASFFDEVSEEDVSKVNAVFTNAMKEPSELIEHPGKMKTKGVSIYEFYYSDKSDAFSFPALITEGESVLEVGLKECVCSVGSPWVTKLINFGGPSKGIEIIIETSFFNSLYVSFEDAQLRWYTKDGVIVKNIEFEKRGNKYISRIDDFEINPGLNKLSAVWCRGHKISDSAEFFVNFTPRSPINVPIKGKITIRPYVGKGVELKFES